MPHIMPADQAKWFLMDVHLVHGIVKLQEFDIEKLPPGKEAWHLNLSPCTNEQGLRYAAVPIVKPGASWRDQPEVDVSNPILLECLNVLPFDSLLDVRPVAYKHLIGLPTTLPDLERLMFRRYGKVRNMTLQDIQSAPVTLSRFARIN